MCEDCADGLLLFNADISDGSYSDPHKGNVIFINLRKIAFYKINKVIKSVNPITVVILNIKNYDDIAVINNTLTGYDTLLHFQISKTPARDEYVLYKSLEDEYIIIASNDPDISDNRMFSESK